MTSLTKTDLTAFWEATLLGCNSLMTFQTLRCFNYRTSSLAGYTAKQRKGKPRLHHLRQTIRPAWQRWSISEGVTRLSLITKHAIYLLPILPRYRFSAQVTLDISSFRRIAVVCTEWLFPKISVLNNFLQLISNQQSYAEHSPNPLAESYFTVLFSSSSFYGNDSWWWPC